MKAKKVNKRLKRVEGLLTAVLDGYSKTEDGVHELLDQAKTAVSTAMTSLKKPPSRATESTKRRLSAAGRKRLSKAAKKRWAVAKKKGVHAVTGLPLRKTA